MGPVSLPTAQDAPRASEAISASEVRLVRSRASGTAAWMAPVTSASAAPPIRTGVMPRAASALASAA